MKELKTIRDILNVLLDGYEVESYFEHQNIWETVDSVCFDTRYLDDEEGVQGKVETSLGRENLGMDIR